MSKYIDLAYKLFGKDSVSKGLSISPKSISLYDTVDRGKNDLVHIFKVDSQHSSYYYDVNIIVRKNEIVSYYCECTQFSNYHTCKHVAACLINYGNTILSHISSDVDISNNILDMYIFNRKNGIKEVVNVDLELDFSRNPSFKLLIGVNKKYTIYREARFDSFVDSFLNNEEFYFGVGFTYDPSIHYISDSDRDLLLYLHGYTKCSGYHYHNINPFELNDRELNSLFEIIKDRDFNIVGIGTVHGVRFSLPTQFVLNSINGNYELSIFLFDSYNFIDKKFKYCVYNSILYVIPAKYYSLLNSMKHNSLKSLIINKEHVDIFKNGLLQSIKDNILISDQISDIVVSGTPDVSLYFDFNQNVINCVIEFNYNGIVVNYFDVDCPVVRDVIFEDNVINELSVFGFFVKNNSLILDDIDSIGDFLSEGIHVLGDKYSVFTSKKIDNVSIVRKSNIKSNFSIGVDGIMSYNFSTDNINMDELHDVLVSLKKKKRYYKLNNGNIIDLTKDNDLNELNSLFDDLGITTHNLSGSIVIPKYRALYIDSLKRNRYKFISTDNSFDSFISNFYKYKDVDISFGSDNSILRDYQKDGVRFLYTLYKCDFGGILADEMGLGKSLQTICFIKQVLNEKPDCKIMIVCPTSLVYNWKKEFDKFGSDLKYVTVSENKSKRLEIINDFDKYNIFITSYGLIRNDNDQYESKIFEVCIIDEAQSIKNYNAGMTREVKKIKARTKIALTGTPLENSVLELWSIFDFIMPGYLGSIYKFKEYYGVNDVDDNSLKKLNNLNYQIHPFILRRKKMDVITDLPDKIVNDVYLDLPDKQKKLYLSVLKDSEKEFRDSLVNEGISKARFKILQLLMKLRQICVDPNILFSNYNGESIKMEKLLETVNGYISDGHKILIFSSFKTVVDRVKTMFDKRGISCYVIAGDVKSRTRMELVDKFNSDSTNCFLITLKSGGTGLNLFGADVVIHLDIWWNPQVENQATDRAHRIGQTKKVSVVRFITRGTIEENIIELQNKKKILCDNLIDGKAESVISSLTEEEIKSLLSYGED